MKTFHPSTYLNRVRLVDAGPEVVRVPSECDLQQFQEAVHSVQQRLGRVRGGVHGRFTLEHDDPVGQIGCHDEIVLHHEAGLLGVEDISVWREMRGGFNI